MAPWALASVTNVSAVSYSMPILPPPKAWVLGIYAILFELFFLVLDILFAVLVGKAASTSYSNSESGGSQSPDAA